jgi:uracil-DNA glycosylase
MVAVVIVGEAHGREEEEAGGKPFVGWAGRLLNQLLAQKGIDRKSCCITNVFNFRPKPTNDVKNLCGRKEDSIPGMPPLAQGKYVLAKYEPELHRLWKELDRIKPNLIICLGATAGWAVTKQAIKIKRVRGTALATPFGKAIITYHPAALARDWSQRVFLLADLEKAAREQHFPEVRRPHRKLWIEPSLEDLWRFKEEHIISSPELSIDIETIGNQITMIGFAPSPEVALVVPFFDFSRSDRNYWPSLREEVQVWEWVRRVCSLPKRIVGQNFLYDMNFLWSQYGIPASPSDDTMLLHHALYPELEKSLAILGSLYTDEVCWKLNREIDTRKKED